MPLRSALKALLILLPTVAAADTLYVGTYTGHGSEGVYTAAFDEVSGKLGRPRLAVATPSPSFIILSPQGDRLYAANELGTEAGGGAASSFAVEAGRLRALSSQPTQGGDPCFLALAHSGQDLFVANYQTGSVAELPVTAEGRLLPARQMLRFRGSGPNSARQEGPHAHCTVVDPSGRYLLVCDLGSDRIRVFTIDPSSGELTAAFTAAMPPGTGPRHLAFAPAGRAAYLISELACTVTALRWEPEAARLTPIQSLSTLPPAFAGKNTAAEIQIDSAGRFLYASNRGDDSVDVFAIAGDGRLSFSQRVSCEGKTPRFFALDPSERFLLAALQDSNLIRVFRRDPQSGQLTLTSSSVRIAQPACLAFAR